MNKDTKEIVDKKESNTQKKPNELSGIYFSSSIKIFDPNTKEVLVNKRGD